jgi:hypothetical protein
MSFVSVFANVCGMQHKYMKQKKHWSLCTCTCAIDSQSQRLLKLTVVHIVIHNKGKIVFSVDIFCLNKSA